jgi:eukaryotic-like serine/threonine-protein kinase
VDPPDSDVEMESEAPDALLRDVARAPAAQPPARWEAVGRRVGTLLRDKYTIDAVLGRGGMAVVYQATHRNNGRQFAIKMLLPEHAGSEDMRRRFRREGRIANAVDHEGAVHVIDDDVAEDGTAFLVLELLKGIACHELAERSGRRLPVAAACSVAIQALAVLQAAHDRNIVHRDVKPANLFVLSDGAVKVLDFGIARVREAMGIDTQTTGSGAILGTPAFMAPEQWERDPSRVDHRTDLWGVGATLFALLSGSLAGIPLRRLSEAAPDVPAAIAQVVERALKTAPGDRWASANEMKLALEQACRAALGHVPSRATLSALVAGADAPWTTTASASQAPSPSSAPPTEGPPADRARNTALHAWLAGTAALMGIAWLAVWPWSPPRGLPAMPRTPAASMPETGDLDAPLRARDPARSSGAATAPQGSSGARTADALPRSCAAARAAGARSDGTITIDPDGPGAQRPFDVYCAGMASGAPAAYLTLPHAAARGEPEANTSRAVRRGLGCDCPDLVRSFERVRLDLATMTVDPTDGTFATYDRDLVCEHKDRDQCGERLDLAWGAAGGCRGGGDAGGRATIDLRGTPFALAPDVRFLPSGIDVTGVATISSDRKVATLVGGGRCGAMAPEEPTIALVRAR